ncbi:MAG: TRAP transporter large permease subunit, partial [Alphaproteobacteria bacterium]
LYLIYLIGVAKLRPEAAPALPARDLGDGRPGVRQLASGLAPPVILFVAVLGSILAGVATPTEAAAIGAVGATLLAGERMDGHRKFPIHAAAVSMVALLALTASLDLRLGRGAAPMADRLGVYAAFAFSAVLAWGLGVALVRLNRAGVLREVMGATTRVTSMVFVILIGAALFSLVFRGFGGDDMVHRVLTSLPGGAVTTMVLVMAVMFVLGFFLDFIEITYVVVPIVAPTLMLMGIDPLWLGVMIAVNLQTSFLTPPFGFALFYLRGVAPPEVTTMDIYRGVAPFVVIQILALAILALFPGIVQWLPRVIYGP